MELQIFNCEQGSPEWFQCRLGIPTASMFDTVMAKGKGGGESKTRRTYMLKLIGERLTGEPKSDYSNDHMERGKVMEDEARNLYAMLNDVELEQVGFMRRGEAGASPDSLIGANGLLEIKTKLAHLQLDCLLSGELPAEHKAQCQGQLWIAQREWLDFVSYWPKLKPLIVRVHRDEAYIAKIKVEVDDFLDELSNIMKKLTQRAA